MKLEEIKFLTTRLPKKAKDFTDFGLGVQAFDIEVLSPDVEIVVLYKAKDTEMNNIVVEDTALCVEGSDFMGTQIKHVYEQLGDDKFYGHKNNMGSFLMYEKW